MTALKDKKGKGSGTKDVLCKVQIKILCIFEVHMHLQLLVKCRKVGAQTGVTNQRTKDSHQCKLRTWKGDGMIRSKRSEVLEGL